MKVIDLHPEEAMDAVCAGTASASQQQMLAQHLIDCQACQLQQRLRGCFAHDVAPRSGDELLAETLVARALNGPLPQKQTAPASSQRTTFMHWLLWPFALPLRNLSMAGQKLVAVFVALCLVTFGATAGAVWFSRKSQSPNFGPASPNSSRDSKDTTFHRRKGRDRQGESTGHGAFNRAEPPPEHEPHSGNDPSAKLLTVGQRADRALGRAVDLRRRGRFVAAAQHLAGLQTRFAGTRHAATALILEAELRLHRLEQVAQALALYDRYLRQHGDGALAEEALLGRALALGRLGHTSAEMAAWQDLQSRFPNTPHKARLLESGSKSEPATRQSDPAFPQPRR